jgi:DNA-binding transcriptional LysR family regulator
VTDLSLVARKIANVARGIYASPRYLARRGTPRTHADLARHDCIVVSAGPALQRWPFRDGKGARVVEVTGRIVVDDAEAALRMAIAGAGIIRVSNLVASAALRAGQLVPLLTASHVVESVPMNAIYPQGRHRMAKVRVFIDFLAERFAEKSSRRLRKTGQRADQG